MLKVSREEVEGVGVVATVKVPSFYHLLAYRPNGNEAKTVVFPSPTCPQQDLPAIVCFSERRGYTYGPHDGLKSFAAAAAGSSKQQGGSSKQGNDEKDQKEEAGQSSRTGKGKMN